MNAIRFGYATEQSVTDRFERTRNRVRMTKSQRWSAYADEAIFVIKCVVCINVAAWWRTAGLILEIDVQTTEDQIPIVKLKGEIDLHTCATFRETLRDLIERKHYNIVIELSEVPYLDSAALGVLVDAVRRVREHDGTISLVNTTPFVRRAFEITRLVKIFHLYDDLDSALASIRSLESAATE